jgi:hypothetical protein
MALSFLRRHQKTVFYPLVVVIIITFVLLFGAGDLTTPNTGVRNVGTINGETITEPVAKAFVHRFELATGRAIGRRQSTSMYYFAVLEQMARQRMAEANALRVSDYEVARQKLRWALQNEDRYQGPDGEANGHITGPEFRRMLHEANVTEGELDKGLREEARHAYLMGGQRAWPFPKEQPDQDGSYNFSFVPTPGLLAMGISPSEYDQYLLYAQRGQRLRLRYRDFAVEAFMDEVEAPEDEEVRTYYDENKQKGAEAAPVLYTQPGAKLQILYGTYEDFKKRAEPTDEALREEYERVKDERYRRLNAEGEPEYQPLEEVKEELADRMRQNLGRQKLDEALEAAQEDFDARIEALRTAEDEGEAAAEGEQEQEGEAEEEQPPRPDLAAKVDLAALAEKHGLRYMAFDEYKSREALQEEIEPLGRLWGVADRVFDPEGLPELKGSLTQTYLMDGRALYRVSDFKAATLKPLEQAREEIVRTLRRPRARDAAKEAADAFVDRMAEGDVEWRELEDTGLLPSTRREVAQFDELPVGHVRTIETSRLEQGESQTVFRSGMLVARDIPDYEAYRQDPMREQLARRQAWEVFLQNSPNAMQLRNQQQFQQFKQRWAMMQGRDPSTVSNGEFQEYLMNMWREDVRLQHWRTSDFLSKYEISLDESLTQNQ